MCHYRWFVGQLLARHCQRYEILAAKFCVCTVFRLSRININKNKHIQIIKQAINLSLSVSCTMMLMWHFIQRSINLTTKNVVMQCRFSCNLHILSGYLNLFVVAAKCFITTVMCRQIGKKTTSSRTKCATISATSFDFWTSSLFAYFYIKHMNCILFYTILPFFFSTF